jgi:FdhD protein
MHDPVHSADRRIWRDGQSGEGARLIPEETAIALTYNGGTYAVMMGTPQDLHDFAVGFSLSEGIVQSPDEIETLDIVELADGIELRMWLKPSRAEFINERRRHIAALPVVAFAASSRLRKPSVPPRSCRRGAALPPPRS